MQQHLHLIGGQRTASSDGRSLPVHDPATGECFARIAAGGAPEIDAAVRAARAALSGPWGKMSPADRGRLLLTLARTFSDHAEELAALESRDTGKPLSQARTDAAFIARYFEFYAGACDKLHGETLPAQPGFLALTLREPHGVTAHIIPWNYPLQMVGRSVGAALAAGNACVLKPAEEACLSALRIGELALAAGLPPGVLNIVTGSGAEAGAALAAHPGINHLSFTGSPQTGGLIQAATGRNNVGCTMELGGKSPQLVFEDADIEAALPVLVGAIIQNGGQTCSAGSRILIQRPLFDTIANRLAEKFRSLTAAAGSADRDLGPLISARQKQRVEDFITQAAADGIPLLARGTVAEESAAGGYFVAPALYGPVPPDHRLAQQEVFGPVLSLFAFDTEEEALALANGTDYGLVAGVWTRDGARQIRVARALHCGQVFVNGYGAGGGVELPFGGVKKSGYGREKGFEALHGFTSLKTILIRHD